MGGEDLDDSVCEFFVYMYPDFGRFRWEGLCSAVVMCVAPLLTGSSLLITVGKFLHLIILHHEMLLLALLQPTLINTPSTLPPYVVHSFVHLSNT